MMQAKERKHLIVLIFLICGSGGSRISLVIKVIKSNKLLDGMRGGRV